MNQKGREKRSGERNGAGEKDELKKFDIFRKKEQITLK